MLSGPCRWHIDTQGQLGGFRPGWDQVAVGTGRRVGEGSPKVSTCEIIHLDMFVLGHSSRALRTKAGGVTLHHTIKRPPPPRGKIQPHREGEIAAPAPRADSCVLEKKGRNWVNDMVRSMLPLPGWG